MKEAVTVYYLGLGKDDFTPQSPVPACCHIRRCGEPVGALHEFFYRWVGMDWGWTDKLVLSPSEWQQHAEDCELWIIYYENTPAGYFELAKLGESTELQYFGLAPFAIGKGIGSYALEFAISTALELTPKVTVNTCSWDHPAALPNYLARGFKELYREIEWR